MAPLILSPRQRSDLEYLASHNPVSNQYLASGIAPVADWLARGVTVALGTDGAASNNTQDMFETMKSAALLQKVTRLDARAMTAEGALELATLGGARALGLADRIGSLKPGAEANVVLFDGDPLQPRSKVDRVFIRGREIELTSRQKQLMEKWGK